MIGQMWRRDRSASQHFLATAKHIYYPGKPLLHPPTTPCSTVLREKSHTVAGLAPQQRCREQVMKQQHPDCCLHRRLCVYAPFWFLRPHGLLAKEHRTAAEIPIIAPDEASALWGWGLWGQVIYSLEALSGQKLHDTTQQTCLGLAVTTVCNHFLEEERKVEEGAWQNNGYNVHLSCYLISFQGPELLLSETTQHMATRGFAP